MNIRKNIDYIEMYAALDAAMVSGKEQMELREWYLRAAGQLGWSKIELTAQIATEAHLEIILEIEQVRHDATDKDEERTNNTSTTNVSCISIEFVLHAARPRCRGRPKRGAVSSAYRQLRRYWFGVMPVCFLNSLMK